MSHASLATDDVPCTLQPYLILNLGPVVDPHRHRPEDGPGQAQLYIPHPHGLLAALQQHLEEDVGEAGETAAGDDGRQTSHRTLGDGTAVCPRAGAGRLYLQVSK